MVFYIIETTKRETKMKAINQTVIARNMILAWAYYQDYANSLPKSDVYYDNIRDNAKQVSAEAIALTWRGPVKLDFDRLGQIGKFLIAGWAQAQADWKAYMRQGNRYAADIAFTHANQLDQAIARVYERRYA
jgi:hypothetical protein